MDHFASSPNSPALATSFLSQSEPQPAPRALFHTPMPAPLSTGQPANHFNKPKVDLGTAALFFDPPSSCKQADADSDGTELVMAKALKLVGLGGSSAAVE
jgi:hypothetical protein